MVARSTGKETFYRVDTGPARPGRGVFTNYRMPDGRLVVSLRRDVYEAALKAAAEAMRKIKQKEEPYKP
ncbi:hypothetical protein [Pedomonas mirosovicensis]|uniref:hypothetical protein n=1 Tax=Pedomonas mirosovicensis TaxID=2908641 RepID=UPI002169E7AD|nr:hypothetical protein [Pedomonas mirosovicensis]MCH8685744.1 hypothetical protein [Pedomonas mirosovicensis]